jgi:hypothetical protein
MRILKNMYYSFEVESYINPRLAEGDAVLEDSQLPGLFLLLPLVMEP